jgi:hypothetical protein
VSFIAGELAGFNGELRRFFPENSATVSLSESLVRIIPELKSSLGKLVEFIVGEYERDCASTSLSSTILTTDGCAKGRTRPRR